MAPSSRAEEFAQTLSALKATLDQLQSAIVNLPRHSRDPLTKDAARLTQTYAALEHKLNELRQESQKPPTSRFSVTERFSRFTKLRDLVKQLNRSIKELDNALGTLESGVRLSQAIELERNRREVQEEERRIRDELGIDQEDNTIILGNHRRHPDFVPAYRHLSVTVNQGQQIASTPNLASGRRLFGFEELPQFPASLVPPPRALGMSRSQDPYTNQAASMTNLEQEFEHMGMGHLGSSHSLLPQHGGPPPPTSSNVPTSSTRRMGHRPAPSFDAFNNRRPSYQQSAHSSDNADRGSIGSTDPPLISRRHSSSSGTSSQSYNASLYPNSSRSGHSPGNQTSSSGSVHASSGIGRSSHSIARSASQHPPSGVQGGYHYHPTQTYPSASIGVSGSQGVAIGNAPPLSSPQTHSAIQPHAGSSPNPPPLSGYIHPGGEQRDENTVWGSPSEYDDIYAPESH